MAPGARVSLLFIGSGFSAVAYQVILSRYTQLIVGSTAHAISALLVAFMLGMAIGSWLGGRWADRAVHPLRIYAWAEAAIGLYCISFPALFPLLEDFYLAIAPPIEGGSLGARNAVRFVVGMTAFLVPSILMGITTPAFARAVAQDQPRRGEWLARVYGWNTVGAAAGAFFTAYVLVPRLGLVGSLTSASVINFSIAWVAHRASRPVPIDKSEGSLASSEARGGLGLLLAAAFGTGLLSFGLEIIWTHLLAILIGNSVYAFGLMLGSLLLGLALGTLAARRLSEPAPRALDALGIVVSLAGLVVIGTLPVWDELPAIFLLMAKASPTFQSMEAVRFAVALGVMLLPTVLFGVSFPLILRSVASSGGDLGKRIGLAYGLNTLGAVLGSLGGAYVLLAHLGSIGSLKALAAGLLLVGGLVMFELASFARHKVAAGLVLAAIPIAWLVPVSWNFNTLSMAAAIYLGDSASASGAILYRREHPAGGLTSVVERESVRTLLTNGKFQGDNSEEVPIQHRLANLTTLFTSGRKRALVIGLGTGVTLAALASHGFDEVVCAEISEPIVEAAGRHFGDVNGGVLTWPNVKLVHEDGRSVVSESARRYDVVSIEVNSIWFAGAGSIYSQEFYRLVQARLRRNGVMLQWFPIHHLSARNLFIVVNTVRSVFPHVSVWTHRHQGFVVSGNEPLAIDLDSVRTDMARPEMRHYLRELASGSPLELLSDLVLTAEDTDAFLEAMARLLRTDRGLVSTDVWPTLEYETPKDVLDNFSYFENRATFRRFRSREAFPFRGEPSPEERALAEIAFLRGWNDPRALTALGEAWGMGGELTAVASRWLLDELGGDDVVATKDRTDPISPLQGASSLVAMVSGGVTEVACVSPIAMARAFDGVPLEVERFSGASIDDTAPEAALERIASPGAGRGWRARPDGTMPSIDLGLDRPRRIRRIEVVASSIDGGLVRVRLLGRDSSGRWLPLAGGGSLDEARCLEVRTYVLPDSIPDLTGLRVDLQGESRTHRLALHQVSAFEQMGASADEPPRAARPRELGSPVQSSAPAGAAAAMREAGDDAK